MKHSRTDKVIVLQRRAFRESDWILHALNPEGICLHFIARGGRKSKKRFGGGVLEPTHYIEIAYQESRSDQGGQSLHVLNEARILHEFAGLRTDYERLEMALGFLGSVLRVSRESAPEGKALFDLLGNALKVCETAKNLRVLQLQFEMKLLFALGVLPLLDEYHDILQNPVAACDAIEMDSIQLRELSKHTHSRLEQYAKGLNF